MKKSLLAAALFGAFTMSAHAQSSVTLYGLIDTGLVYTNNQFGHSNWQEVSSSTQNTVFGLKGSEDLGGGLHAVFKLEQGFLLNNGAQAFSGDGFGSQAWVGLQSDPYGTLTFGRQFDVMNDLVGPLTAEFNTWGGSMAAHPFENDNLAIFLDRHRTRRDPRAVAADIDRITCLHRAFAHVEEDRFELGLQAVGRADCDVAVQFHCIAVAIVGTMRGFDRSHVVGRDRHLDG